MKVTGIVLAGGKNLRLGRNKALEVIGGKILIEYVIERLSPVVDRILVVTSREKIDLPTADKAEILLDIYPDSGPLGGIYTGLLNAKSQYSVVVACDMPFLNTELLRYMISLSPGFEAVVPRLEEKKLEPLHAIYSKNCLDKIKTLLEHNELRVNSLLKSVKVRYVERAECEKLDPQLLSFFNINRQSDLERALAIQREQILVKDKLPTFN